jgi:hypothetical protein
MRKGRKLTVRVLLRLRSAVATTNEGLGAVLQVQ